MSSLEVRNGAMSEVHLARFNAVREFDDYRINCELDGIDVSNMMSRRDFVHFLNKSTQDIVELLPKTLQERLDMMKNNKEQGSENINKKKRKWNKKRKTNEVDYDVSAADLFPDDGKDYNYKVLDLSDPKVKADIDEKGRQVELLIKQYEKEEAEADEEEMKKKKEKKKKKKMMKMKEEEEKKMEMDMEMKKMKNNKNKSKSKKLEMKRSGSSCSSGSSGGSRSSRSSTSSTITQEFNYPFSC